MQLGRGSELFDTTNFSTLLIVKSRYEASIARTNNVKVK